MATYTIQNTPVDYNYYEDIINTGHPDISTTPNSSDVVKFRTGGTVTFDTDMLSGTAMGSGTPFDHYLYYLYFELGTAVFDGTKVRHIEITGESGTAPTRGDTITFSGGTTGEFIRFHTIDTVKYMKLRSLTGAVADSETITDPGDYGATTVSADHVGTLEMTLLSTEAFNSEYSQGSTITTTGEWYILRDSTNSEWQSDGSNSQTVEHYSEDFVPALWVETGSGTNVWELYTNICTQAFTSYQEGPVARCFHKPVADNTITFGSTVNGNTVPPTGARVRCPNLHFGKGNATNWETEGGTSSSFIHPLVNYNVDKSEFGTLPLAVTSTLAWVGTVIVTDSVGAGYRSGWYNAPAANFDWTWTRVGFVGHRGASTSGVSTMFMSQGGNGSGSLTLIDCFLITPGGNYILYNGGNGPTVDLVATDTIIAANVTTGTDTSIASHQIQIWCGGTATLSGCTTYGDGPNFTKAPQGASISNHTSYSHSVTTPNNVNNHSHFYTNEAVDIVLDGITINPNSAWNRQLFDFGKSLDCLFKNVGTWESPIDCSTLNFTSTINWLLIANMTNVRLANFNISSPAGLQCSGLTNCVFQNCAFQWDETGAGYYVGLNATYNKNTLFRSCRITDGTIVSNLALGGVATWTTATDLMISDFFTSDTTGFILMSIGDDDHADFSNAPSAFRTFRQATVIPTLGEYATYQSSLILGHTGFSTGGALYKSDLANNADVSAYDWEYQIDTNDGNGYSSWKALKLDGTEETNLTAETISPSLGFYIRFKCTRVAATSISYTMAEILIYTTTTLADQRDNIHPVDLIDITLQNLQNPSTYRIYNVTDAVEEATGTITTAGDTTLQLEIASGKQLSFRIGGEQTILFTGAATTTADGASVYVSQITDNFRTVSNTTALAYTGITVVGDTSVTISGTRTIQELYEYLMAWQQQSNMLQYEVPISTADGSTFIINTADYTWSITGSVIGIEDTLSGLVASMVASGGFFEDITGAIWDVGGTKYYASHLHINVKDNISNANIPDAVVAFVETDTDTDQTYNTSLVNGGLVTDASGNIEGYVVWKVDTTTYGGHNQYVGEYNYNWSTVPRSIAGATIGTSAARIGVRLNTDSNVTLTKSNALAVSGVTVNHTTSVVDLSLETNSDVSDNLKARQASISDIETGVAGYMSFHDEGLLIDSDGSFYNGIATWTYKNQQNTADTGVWKTGIIQYDAPVNSDLDYNTVTMKYTAIGTYDHRNETMDGTITLTNTSGGAVTVQLDPTVTYVNSGPNITVEASIAVDVSVTGMPTDGAQIKLQLVNTTASTSTAWQASTAYSLGDRVLRTTGVGTENLAGLFFVCTTAGTSNDTEPTWDTTQGNSTTDTNGTGASDVVWTTYNVQFYNGDPASSIYTSSYIDGQNFTSGDTVRVRFAELNGSTTFKTFSQNSLASSTGISVLVDVVTDTVYGGTGWTTDGSLVTKFTANFGDDYIEMASDSDFTAEETYAFYCYQLTTTTGIHDFWGGYTAFDSGNYRINQDILNLLFDSPAGATYSVKQTDSARIYREDLAYPVLDPTTSGYGIDINWKSQVFVVEVATGDAINKATVQSAMTDQGYTTTRSPKLDNLDIKSSKLKDNTYS